ncbi:type VI secretion system baseplate subunit TssG [Marinobacter sp. chi1]|uniref:Type VI secretion system baseplate subunit TssG n=1 Tax=Marinobacter suaedae TaxID=3057675 RepID=A0ABT8VW18_9GAMM|nr:type VI secretion system baseplate subunit TssG [Marinobacter sp. chi1]MDO3720181.1 type VI secretion system baseplate subunit TssG [Marinobacter sp. chi1]
MATEKRRTIPALIKKLEQSPERFELFQTLHLLHFQSTERPVETAADKKAGRYRRIHYKLEPGLAFHNSSVNRVHVSEGETEVTLSAMTLVGSRGVMPVHYSELLAAQLRRKETGLKAFFEIFNQRTIELLYRAWLKHRLPQGLEQGTQSKTSSMTMLSALLGLYGHGLQQLPASPKFLGGVSGLLGRPTPSAQTLKQLAEHYLGLTVTIEQFKGEWVPIPVDLQTQLPKPTLLHAGTNHQLGKSCILGSRNWFIQGRFTVVIQVENESDLLALHPDKKPVQQLKKIVKYAAGPHQAFNLVIETRKSLLRTAGLGITEQGKSILGWNTALTGHKKSKENVRININ